MDDVTGHFDQHIKLREMILEKHPKVIVEVGAGDGANTRLLAGLKSQIPFRLVSISDKKIEVDGAEFIEGISYEKLREFPDDSIGMCIIDTDHNYWTLSEELLAVIPKMEEGGWVVMHDVEEFYYNSGIGGSYWNDHPYPSGLIQNHVKYGGAGMALIDFLSEYRGYFKLKWWNPNHFGCAVIERVNIKETAIIMPGINPVFAKVPA